MAWLQMCVVCFLSASFNPGTVTAPNAYSTIFNATRADRLDNLDITWETLKIDSGCSAYGTKEKNDPLLKEFFGGVGSVNPPLYFLLPNDIYLEMEQAIVESNERLKHSRNSQ